MGSQPWQQVRRVTRWCSVSHLIIQGRSRMELSEEQMCFLKLGRRPCADWWVAGEVFATGIAFHHLSSNLYLFIHNTHHLYFILFGVVFVSWQKRPPLAKERWKRTRTSPSFVSDCLCCHTESLTPDFRSNFLFSSFISLTQSPFCTFFDLIFDSLQKRALEAVTDRRTMV